MSYRPDLLLKDIQDRLVVLLGAEAGSLSAQFSDVHIVQDLDEIEWGSAAPWAAIALVSSTRSPGDSENWIWIHDVAILVAVDIDQPGGMVVGASGYKGAWELAELVLQALVGHYFAPWSGDRSGPHEFAGDGEPIEIVRVELAIEGDPDPAYGMEGVLVPLQYQTRQTA